MARSLLTNPRLFLLDEPHEGLSTKVAEDVRAAILELKQSGVAMLISEQALFAVKRCADRICIIDRGLVAWAGTPAQFDADPGVAEKYLMVHARAQREAPRSPARSEARRVGNECVSTCRSRGSPDH